MRHRDGSGMSSKSANAFQLPAQLRLNSLNTRLAAPIQPTRQFEQQPNQSLREENINALPYALMSYTRFQAPVASVTWMEEAE